MPTKHSTAGYDIVDLKDLTGAERAEVRATEDGRNARSAGHLRQYRVQGQVNRSQSYLCTVTGPSIGAPVRVTCNCKSGVHRAEAGIPCRHAGRVVIRLRAEGLTTYSTELRCDVYTEAAAVQERDRLNAELETFEAFRASKLALDVFG